MTDNNEKHPHQNGGIHLIASDKDHNFQYEGFCKIIINRMKSLLFVEPINEEFKFISAMFKWKFFAQKNILFVFADFEFQDFILVFNNEIRCKKVYNLIYRKRVKDDVTNEQIYQRILSPIFNQIVRISNITVSEILLKWLNNLKKQENKFYIESMKNDAIYDLSYPKSKYDKQDYGNINDEIDVRILRKRRFCKIDAQDTSENESLLGYAQKDLRLQSIRFIKSQCIFKIANINGRNKLVKRLLVFTSKDKKLCYEYCPNKTKTNILSCIKCRKMGKGVYAKINQDDNLLLQNKEHVCSAIPYSAEKYFDLQIIKKPNYEILDNTNTTSGKVLLIFNQNDRTQCHEYRWSNNTKSFCCLGCGVKVEIYNVAKENEYIELLQLVHKCRFRPYDPEKFFNFKNFVLAPNFEIRIEMKDGKERKSLIIFDQDDKEKCYIYNFQLTKNVYVCKYCTQKGSTVSAKMHQNAESENYIVLSNAQHICKSVEYILPKNDDIILRPPCFKVMEETSNGIPKVFIFDSNDMNRCYIFSHRKNSSNKFICLDCHDIIYRKLKKNPDNSSTLIYLSLCKDENGEYYVQIKNRKHLCQPKKYEPEKYQIAKHKTADKYFYYRRKALPKSVNVAILHPNDSTLCYLFSYWKKSNYFHCLNCAKFKKSYDIPPPKMDENGKEYFLHNPQKHACQPIKTSSIQNPKFQRLAKKDITFEKKPLSKKKEKKIDENRILKIPNFEFRPNKQGNPEGKLVVFNKNDTSFCYEYYYEKRGKKFVCSKCQEKKRFVSAKVHFEKESNEKFIEISENEHVCEPIKDEFKDKVINASDFLIINRDDETKATKIIAFTSESKEFYYEFCYISDKNLYRCGSCKKHNTYVGVKLIKKENGEEYLLKMDNEHVCIPKIFDQHSLKLPKIIPKSMFQLYQNRYGEANKRLIVFTSDKKDFVYEYCWQRPSFCCSECKKQNKSVTAKLLGDDAKSLELSVAEHICKPKPMIKKNI